MDQVAADVSQATKLLIEPATYTAIFGPTTLVEDVPSSVEVFKKGQHVNVMRAVLHGSEILYLLTPKTAILVKWNDLDFGEGPSKCFH